MILTITRLAFTSGKIPRIRIGGAPPERAVVLKWFYSQSRRNTFVRGKCALLSALVVSNATTMVETIQYITKLNNNTSK